jgi:hypothetical protein
VLGDVVSVIITRVKAVLGKGFAVVLTGFAAVVAAVAGSVVGAAVIVSVLAASVVVTILVKLVLASVVVTAASRTGAPVPCAPLTMTPTTRRAIIAVKIPNFFIVFYLFFK